MDLLPKKEKPATFTELFIKERVEALDLALKLAHRTTKPLLIKTMAINLEILSVLRSGQEVTFRRKKNGKL